ncbi:LysR family transcriptional regulator [Ramlibacter sp. G-1-2-2]|uniref:LysR family transcriptional regulator n=1 Tax=Ramlibacter agri TaxID=2728837 RepID=A0A848H0G5_9BURK|nr:LysR substrate-binding domain-containing protein [Ramlibacter agri]NML42263.1 LysR family transcriptional regulator [Ramlibacter agri]
MKQLELSSMRIFAVVAECGSMSAAADRCSLTVAAVSKRIRDLESSFGNQLFLRHARGMALTAAGHALLQHARDIMGTVEKMRSEQRQLARGITGVVRIASMSSAVTQFLPADIRRFTEQHPNVAIDLTEATTPEVVEAVVEGRADVGIFLAPIDHDLLATYEYHRDALGVAVPLEHALARRTHVSFSELLESEFIALAPRSTIVQRMLSESDGALKIRLHVRTSEAMCRMVGAGLGIGICPLGAARSNRHVADIHVLELDEPWAVRQLLIGVRPDEDAVSGAARVFLAHCRAAASLDLDDD